MHEHPKLTPKPTIHPCFLEIDKNADAGYIHIYPYSHKSPGQVTKTEQIENKNGMIVNFDWNNGKLVGIEILDANRNFEV